MIGSGALSPSSMTTSIARVSRTATPASNAGGKQLRIGAAPRDGARDRLRAAIAMVVRHAAHDDVAIEHARAGREHESRAARPRVVRQLEPIDRRAPFRASAPERSASPPAAPRALRRGTAPGVPSRRRCARRRDRCCARARARRAAARPVPRAPRGSCGSRGTGRARSRRRGGWSTCGSSGGRRDRRSLPHSARRGLRASRRPAATLRGRTAARRCALP